VTEREVRVTSPDKVMWPATGFTKAEMVDYYVAVSDALLPHLAGRPLTLGRFPDGVDGKGFAQNECRGHPDWMTTAPLRLSTGEVRNYCVVNDVPSLVWVANLGAIELHPYLALAERPDEPVVIAFDLDPHPPRGLLDCCLVALRLRDALTAAGLAGLPKTSGAAGLHVFARLHRSTTYEETRGLAREIAAELAAERPELVSDSTKPRERADRVFVDWLQNAPRRSTVAPYSLRATDVPRVSTPLSWDEVEDAVARASAEHLAFGPAEVLERVERHGDLFA
jgi:bifunctional non-homologous end joining protein LigD